jgi:proline iminopeptidase
MEHSTFKPAFSALADVAQLIYVDHRGHGRSDHSSAEYWILQTWADDVRAFCDKLEIEHPIVMGSSFGGFVAMAYAARYPNHPSKLILSNTKARTHMQRMLDAFERHGGQRARDAAQKFWQTPGPDTFTEYIRVCVPLYLPTLQAAERSGRTIFNIDVLFSWAGTEQLQFNLLPELSRVRCPTLVLAGEDDPVCPIEDAEEMVAALPQHLVRFERFPHVRHELARELDEQYFKVIREFIGA